MSASAGQKRIPFSCGCMAGAAGVLAVLAIATAAYFFLQYRQTGAQHVDTSQASVAIARPGNMAQFTAGSPINVEVNASGQQPFTSTELWINGKLEGVQAGPPAGLTQLTSSFAWNPQSSGNFSLVARAIDQKNAITTSPAVIVFINPAEKANQADPEASKVYPAVLPAAPAGQSNPPPPPTSADPIIPAAPWQGSPIDWATDLTVNSLPSPPELEVYQVGCDIKLSIHDLSVNEEGFAVYRQSTNDANWVHAADLKSHAGTGWIGYLESGLNGGITYYVTAFNSKGEASSNLALINIDPQACPQPLQPSKAPVLYVRVQNLVISEGAGEVYCYNTLGKKPWLRWPDLGFVTSAQNGQDLPQLIEPLALATLSDQGVSPALQTMDLKLECWAWQGGKLLSLGNFKGQIDTLHPAPLHVALSGVAFDISPDVIDGIKYKTFKLEGGIGPWLLDQDPYSVDTLGYVPESDQMPKLLAWITYDADVCKNFNLDAFGKELNCYPMPGYNAGPGGINPQPYLVWYVFNYTCEGAPEKECFSEDWWVHFNEHYPRQYYEARPHFYVFSYGFNNGQPGGSIGEEVELDQQGRRILANSPMNNEQLCVAGFRLLQVSLIAQTGLGNFTSKSNMVYAPCYEPLGNSVDLMVVFDTLNIQNIDDGAANNDADHVWGQFTGRVNGNPGVSLLAGWAGGSSPTDYGGSNGYIQTLNNGVYNLANFQLCRYGLENCDYNVAANYDYNKNFHKVTLKSGDALLLHTELYDFDDWSPADAICNTDQWIGPRTLEQWAATDHEVYVLNNGGDQDANCNVQVTINAVPPN